MSSTSVRSSFVWPLLVTVVGGLIVEALAPPIREWHGRRQLKRKRRRFRQPCAGPAADYCEIHGECHLCCANAGGVCKFHGAQP